MKRLSLLLLVFVMIFQMPAYAYERISVRMNDQAMAFDTEPIIVDDRTLVPLRAIAETLGGEVTWEPEWQVITIAFDTHSLYMKVGSTSYAIGEQSYQMDTAPIINEDRTMVPLRVISETFGCEVAWDEATRTVQLTKEGVQVPAAYKAADYSEEELLWLARIVNVEGLDIGYEAKLAIANVVLNRVKGDEYPDTVYDVIKDRAYAVQFPPAHRSSFDSLVPDSQSLLAARDALEGVNNVEDCLYFNNSHFRSKADDLYTVIDGEYFYR